MVFSSPLFLFFYLPVVLLTYYLSPLKWRNAVLFVFNMLFYGWGEPVYILLMGLSTILDYTCGLMIERNRGDQRRMKRYVTISIAGNLFMLFTFKYLDFIIINLSHISAFSQLQPVGIPLPIGISFYTFQTMSYTIDVYRGVCSRQKNFVTFGTYVTLFPQLIAGPIVQYKDVETQLEHRKHNVKQFADGILIFTVGLAKKVLLANTIGALWNNYLSLGLSSLTVLGAWIGVIAFGFQIYFDFSGYSDMAIGLGRMLAFEFLPNFNYPYISQSITEFWRRWHISLSSWFREYLYFPLGGSRKGMKRTVLNLFIVWIATGIWHGANWNFLLWGVYFFVLLVMEKLFLLRLLERLPKLLRHGYAIFFIVVGWAIFATEDITQCLARLGVMFDINAVSLASPMDWYYLKSYLPLFVLLSLASVPFWANSVKKMPEYLCVRLTGVFVAMGLLLCTASLINSNYNPFLYFRF